MTTIQVANQTITGEEIIPLLANYQILPKLSREVFIDRTIKSISCTPAEKDRVVQQFYQQKRVAVTLRPTAESPFIGDTGSGRY